MKLRNEAQAKAAIAALVEYLSGTNNNTNVARSMLEQARSLKAFADGDLVEVGRCMYRAQRHLEG